MQRKNYGSVKKIRVSFLRYFIWNRIHPVFSCKKILLKKTHKRKGICKFHTRFYSHLWLLQGYVYPILKIKSLTHFMPLISFDTPWKRFFQGVSKEISGMKQVNYWNWSSSKFKYCKCFYRFFEGDKIISIYFESKFLFGFYWPMQC